MKIQMLFDGMGSDALIHHLPEDSFLRRHWTADISSVFPPAATAAVTCTICDKAEKAPAASA